MPAAVPRYTVTCPWCGCFMEKTLWHINNQRNHFCDKVCKKTWQASPLNDAREKISASVKALHNDPTSSTAAVAKKRSEEGNVLKTCAICSKGFRLWKSQASKGFGSCCSRECQRKRDTREGLKAGDKNGAWKGGKIQATCVKCGLDLERFPSLNKEENFCSISCSRLDNPKYMGENAWNWKGGGDSAKTAVRTAAQCRHWVLAVLKRDGYKCVVSGATKNLEVHHIIPLGKMIDRLGITRENWQDYSDILFNVNNGITLSKFEHNLARNKELQLANYYRSLLNLPPNPQISTPNQGVIS